ELLPARTHDWVQELFVWMQTVRLHEVSSSAQITSIITRYAIELRVSGGIVELLGEMGQVVLDSPAGDDTRLDEVLGDASYELFADKITRLSGVWREVLERIVRSEAGEQFQAKLLTQALSDLLHSDSAPFGLSRLALALEARVAAALVRRLRSALVRQSGSDMLAVVSPELVRSVADEVWASVSALRLRELFALIDKQDLEDFIVLGHEFWLAFRKSPYFQRLMQEMVDYFFAKYGTHTLTELIDDMGVSEQMVAQELGELLAPIVARALDTGFLERQIRAQLRTFYESSACSSALANL
ncbi:MAG TPA: hypothetical protein VFX59_07705, partial [Polyangiales bacterium]|nr:hypothetical protein [Polyangiales bacterium]